ncbi:hypothetical protein BVI1335_3670003 [Burkholderia vietnamiensis]|nr:hypothetical protein BVI1335_3670003 [Burkholderia vietnamiensis]
MPVGPHRPDSCGETKSHRSNPQKYVGDVS